MGRKTKKFIDKKNATTFQLIHRSTGAADRPDETPYVLQTVRRNKTGGEDFVDPDLVVDQNEDSDYHESDDDDEIDMPPMSSTSASAEGEAQKRKYREDDYEFGEYGFPDDGYDYSKHFKPSGGGVYIPSEVFDPKRDDPARKALEESERILSRIDPEVLEVLNGDLSSDEAEDLEDNFLEIAGGVTADPETLDHLHGTFISKKKAGEDFDPEEHKRKIKAMLRGKRPHDGFNLEDDEEFDSDFDEYDDESDEEGPRRRHDIGDKDRALLEEQFEYIERQYDDEELGELDEEDPTIRGQADISQFADVISDYLSSTHITQSLPRRSKKDDKPKAPVDDEDEEDEDEEFEESDEEEGSGHRHRHPHGNGAGGKPLSRYCDEDDVSSEDEEVHRKWKERVLKKAEEEEALEAKKKERQGDESDDELVILEEPRKDWDCESVLSSYTNTENHPKLLEEPKRQPKQIKISAKTGMPVGVLPPRTAKKPTGSAAATPSAESNGVKKSSATTASTTTTTTVRRKKVPKGVPRPKDETPEEKRERKKALKEERKQNRERKKELKTKFSREEQRQKGLISSNRVQPAVLF